MKLSVTSSFVLKIISLLLKLDLTCLYTTRILIRLVMGLYYLIERNSLIYEFNTQTNPPKTNFLVINDTDLFTLYQIQLKFIENIKQMEIYF